MTNSTIHPHPKICRMTKKSIKNNLPSTDKGTYTIGERLRKIRKSLDLTQEQLADQIGANNFLISDYERGRLKMNAEVAVALARALSVTTDELLGCENEEKPSQSLYRRFKKIESLPIASQKTILDSVDALIRGLQV